MQRVKINIEPEMFPDAFRRLVQDADIFDSSCSEMARVYFVDKDEGYFLKNAPKGTLEKEAKMTEFFASKGLAATVHAYESLDTDWMLTGRVQGEDCIFNKYLDEPEKLCDTLAGILRQLHGMSWEGCPVPERTKDYIAFAERNYKAGHYDPDLFHSMCVFSSAEEAWSVFSENCHILKTDTLIHGDYCLPNIILDNWRFSGFIDLDNAGVGDRHIDLFWGMWTFQYNLHTDKYASRFLDAYGREDVNEEMFRVIAAAEVFG